MSGESFKEHLTKVKKKLTDEKVQSKAKSYDKIFQRGIMTATTLLDKKAPLAARVLAASSAAIIGLDLVTEILPDTTGGKEESIYNGGEGERWKFVSELPSSIGGKVHPTVAAGGVVFKEGFFFHGEDDVYEYILHVHKNTLFVRRKDKAEMAVKELHELAKAQRKLTQEFMEELNPDRVVFGKAERENGQHFMIYNTNESLKSAGIGPDSCVQTALGQAIGARVKAFNKQGIFRNILLLGPPGTGKSQLAREIADNVGGLGLEVAGWASEKLPPLNDLSSCFTKCTLIVDDIDRYSKESKLSILESTKEFANVIASANVKDDMLPAMQRPGRFDEVIVIDTTPKEVALSLLGKHADAYDQVAHLPIAYINEYKDLAEVMGRAYADEQLPGLLERYKNCKWST